MNEICFNSFYALNNDEMQIINGGWTAQNTCDLVVVVACAAISCAGPAGAVVSICISIGYTIGRGL